ncbi:MAG: hypothetical protein ACRD27_07830 [Terracidiphilus sp.]
MNAKLLGRALCLGMAAAFALPFAATAVAQQTLETIHVKAPAGVDPIALLSRATGLTQRQIQMVLGCRTCSDEYASGGYQSVDRKFEKALGPEIYQHVKSQHELSAQDVQNLTAMTSDRKGM